MICQRANREESDDWKARCNWFRLDERTECWGGAIKRGDELKQKGGFANKLETESGPRGLVFTVAHPSS